MISTADDSGITDADRRAMNKLAAGILFTSQGIPFIQSGQEFLRSKDGDENSYNKPDMVNMLRWQKKLLNNDLLQYYRGLIELRKASSAVPICHRPAGTDRREVSRSRSAS